MGSTDDETDIETRSESGASRDVVLMVRLPDRTDAVRLEEGKSIVIGRGENADIVVDHAKASRAHATIRLRAGVLFVEDLGSRNGTRVNDRVIRGESIVLRSGDRVIVGSAEIVASVPESRGDDEDFLEVELAQMLASRGGAVVVIRVAFADPPADDVLDAIDREVGEDGVVIPRSELEVFALCAGAGAADARARIAAIAKTGNISVARHPEDGRTARELARAAERAAGRALPERPDIIVADPVMMRVYELVRRIADGPTSARQRIAYLVCANLTLPRRRPCIATASDELRQDRTFIQIARQNVGVCQSDAGIVHRVHGLIRLRCQDCVSEKSLGIGKDLGLLVIDEEHRFGVNQKEKIKALRSEIDILTLTATPIPRTLNMALGSLRDLSIIATIQVVCLAAGTYVVYAERPLALVYVDGSDLDRFSKYGFGFFGDTRVHGYRSGRVRAESAYVAHASYGFEIGELLRLDAQADVAWASDEESGLEDEMLAGVGVYGGGLMLQHMHQQALGGSQEALRLVDDARGSTTSSTSDPLIDDARVSTTVHYTGCRRPARLDGGSAHRTFFTRTPGARRVCRGAAVLDVVARDRAVVAAAVEVERVARLLVVLTHQRAGPPLAVDHGVLARLVSAAQHVARMIGRALDRGVLTRLGPLAADAARTGGGTLDELAIARLVPVAVDVTKTHPAAVAQFIVAVAEHHGIIAAGRSPGARPRRVGGDARALGRGVPVGRARAPARRGRRGPGGRGVVDVRARGRPVAAARRFHGHGRRRAGGRRGRCARGGVAVVSERARGPGLSGAAGVERTASDDEQDQHASAHRGYRRRTACPCGSPTDDGGHNFSFARSRRDAHVARRAPRSVFSRAPTRLDAPLVARSAP